MSMSLRDQLIAAGLGTKKQAKEATQAKRPPSRHQAPPPPSPQQIAANKALAAKNARDKELNRRQQEKAAVKARRAEIKQLIEQFRLPAAQSEEFYNFADGNRLARLPVTPTLREQLINGTVVIVRYEGHYAIVPQEAAERIRERDEHVVVQHDSEATASASPAAAEDDPYKDFVVPDDLVW